MNRKAARQLAKTTLQGLGLFHTVFAAPVRKLGGISPVAMLSGLSIQDELIGRGTHQQPHTINLIIYVRNDAGNEETAENLFDDLALAVIAPLRAAGFSIDPSNSEPYGAVLNEIDGFFYRAERFPLRHTDYEV